MTIVAVAAISLLPYFVSAQAPAIGQRMALTASPTNPSPGQSVSLTVSSSEIDINLSNIEWSVDGKSLQKGTGLKTFSATAPANGKSLTVSVRVTPRNGTPIDASTTFSPADMDLIWEATDSYVPPFYKGKALPVKQSAVKVVAIPNVRTAAGAMVKPSDFSFAWKKDGQNMQGSSGFGVSSFSYINQILQDTNRVDVAASTFGKSVDGGIVVPYFEPKLLFYTSDSLTGTKHQSALQNGYRSTGAQLSIVLEPYFLPKRWRTDPNTTLVWKLNGQAVNAKDRQNLSVNTSGETGSFTVTAAYNETKRLFRSFTKTLTVTPQ